MATVMKMPKLSDAMVTGTLAKWHKSVGAAVQQGDVLADIITDKATMELEAEVAGLLLYQGLKAGEEAPIGATLAIIGEKGEDIKTLTTKQPPLKGDSKPTPPAKVEAKHAPNPLTKPASSEEKQPPHSAIKASPLAKQRAEQLHIDLTQVPGSGPNGRIVEKDIAPSTPTKALTEHYTDRPISPIRKIIAQRMLESATNIPHFHLNTMVVMDQVLELHETLQASFPLSFNDIFVVATAQALQQHPSINAAWQGETIRYYDHIHLGIAVALENEGLVVPVWKFADQHTLSQTAEALPQLLQRARAQQLAPEEVTGSTFTLSNLGMLGITSFQPIINPPAACILAIGAIQKQPLFKEEHLVPGHVLVLTLSCDHRVLDGATGATFLQTLKHLLEHPAQLLI